MKRPHLQFSPPAGYTLVEILVATTLSLMLLGGVITMFGRVGESITDARSMLEAADRLRLAAERLQQDLAGVTVTMIPPRKPEANEGYFEYIEGPISQATASSVAVNTDNSDNPDPTVGDFDDILMFTTRTSGRPFVGKCASAAGGTVQSDVAEVAWFLRGRTLHRRVLLVAPSATLTVPAGQSYYAANDISARLQGGVFVANTLGDLTRRECRFAHSGVFPSNVRNWSWSVNGSSAAFPTLPTLAECSDPNWAIDRAAAAISALANLDFWTNAANARVPDAAYATNGTRVADDIILTNVIGFDVKLWDPTANGGLGGYVELGAVWAGATTRFGGFGDTNSPVAATDNTGRVYDTWSTSHFNANWADGLDNDASGAGYGKVDDDGEKGATLPPYPHPLRGIQVKIRVFEPDSRQIREVTVVQDFLPQ